MEKRTLPLFDTIWMIANGENDALPYLILLGAVVLPFVLFDLMRTVVEEPAPRAVDGWNPADFAPALIFGAGVLAGIVAKNSFQGGDVAWFLSISITIAVGIGTAILLEPALPGSDSG